MDNIPPSKAEQQKQHVEYCSLLINKIASAANCELTEATVAVYLEFLLPLSNGNLAAASQRTIAEWDKPNMMPPISFIVARINNPIEQEAIRITKTILARSDKPADWVPLAGETDATIRTLTKRGTVTKAEIAQWLAEGKARGNAHKAALAQDPQWREEQARHGVPEYRQHAENLMAKRNGKSTVPVNSDERQSWARQKAVETGWVLRQSREAGDEAE